MRSSSYYRLPSSSIESSLSSVQDDSQILLQQCRFLWWINDRDFGHVMPSAVFPPPTPIDFVLVLLRRNCKYFNVLFSADNLSVERIALQNYNQFLNRANFLRTFCIFICSARAFRIIFALLSAHFRKASAKVGTFPSTTKYFALKMHYFNIL